MTPRSLPGGPLGPADRRFYPCCRLANKKKQQKKKEEESRRFGARLRSAIESLFAAQVGSPP